MITESHDLPDPNVFDTCVVIPTHPGRGAATDPDSLLGQAVASVYAQTVKPRAMAIAVDLEGHGAGPTRRQALEEALGLGTEWVSFLDSDDLLYPEHLRVHRGLLLDPVVLRQEPPADVAYSYFDGNRMEGWETTHRGRPWNPAEPHHITMTITVRSELAAQAIDAFGTPVMHQDWSGEDWAFILKLNELGARFVGTGEVTWHYRVHHGNTSGLTTKGDATVGR